MCASAAAQAARMESRGKDGGVVGPAVAAAEDDDDEDEEGGAAAAAAVAAAAMIGSGLWCWCCFLYTNGAAPLSVLVCVYAVHGVGVGGPVKS